MPTEHVKCIVCESPCTRQPGVGDFARYDCQRCGAFVLNGSADAELPGKLAEAPVRRSLMSHTLRRMQRPNAAHLRKISSDDLPSFWSVGRLPTPQQQANNLILWIGDNQEGPAWFVDTTGQVISAHIGVAISPNGNREVFDWLHNELGREALYELIDQGADLGFKLTMRGWAKYEELKKKDIDSRIAFMAMKFGDATLNRAVDECFRPAVERAGFRLRVLTDEQPAGLIDDQLRAAILSSRFLIADLIPTARMDDSWGFPNR